MIGDDPTGKDSEPMIPEALNRSASFSDTDTHRPADLPWSRVPTGRRISFAAWGIAGVVGILLWVVIVKLI